MTRLRVHELAKELNIDNKDLIERIEKLGFPVKNHMSTLSDTAVLKIRQQFAEVRTGSEKVEEKRIGREIIRRRKRFEVAMEPEAPQAPGVSEVVAQAVMESPRRPPVEVSAAAVESLSGAAVQPSEGPGEATFQPTAPGQVEEVFVKKAKPVVRPERKHEAARIVRPAPVREEVPAREAPSPIEKTPPAEVVGPPHKLVQPAAKAVVPPLMEPGVVEPRAVAKATSLKGAAVAEEEEEEEEERGRRRGKKRRRKKAKKEE
ncbi:MAG TPA: translation initiation factor IF-2 N-terminal domain-containing protein, partial [Syntrophobacteraceae bacterium]|nr:translation initiation factor IF-2 N-terminal domain-containing protein [Syntrophobacteraceae bacterium]